VLANVVSVVRCVDEVRIVENSRGGGKTVDDGVDQLINRLQRLQTLAVPVVVVVDFALVQLADRLEVRRRARLTLIVSPLLSDTVAYIPCWD